MNLFEFADTALPSPTPATIPPAVSRAARVLAGERKKQRAIRQVSDAADPSWLSAAEAVVRHLAASGQEFSADAVWDALPPGCSTSDPRAMGSVFLRLARQGVIVQTGEHRKSVRPKSHRCPKAVWRGAGAQ